MEPKSSSAENCLKIAVVPYKELDHANQNGNKETPNWILFMYDPNKRLEENVASMAESFKLTAPLSNYALMLTEKSGASFPHYITEENRNEITNGSVVQVYYSAKCYVSSLLRKTQTMTTDVGERVALMKEILEHSSDSVFVSEFDSQQGINWLVKTIQNKDLSRELHCCGLEIFNKIMEHEIIRWGGIEKQFIDSVISNLYKFEADQEEERKIQINSLMILESSLQYSPGKFINEIERQFSLPNMIQLLKNDKFPPIQQAVLAFINSYISRVDSTRRQAVVATLSSKPFKETILQHVVYRKNDSSNKSQEIKSSGTEMQHQLYVMQTLLLKSYDEKLFCGANYDEAREKVMEIRNNYLMTLERESFDTTRGLAFKSTASIASGSSNSSNLSEKNYSEDFERLGFPNIVHPWETFNEPPGALALDLLFYFSKVHSDSFVRFIIENSSSGERSHDCPLVIAAIRLTKLICDLLGIGQQPREEGKEFYPMLIEAEKPLEEFFSIGLSLFNRTWHEIHATGSDIDIVCDFLREKLCKTLANPNNTNKFDSFKKELSKITYADIKARWLEDRKKRDQQKEELTVIKELRTLLKPEIQELVKQNRLNYLVKGTRFDKYTLKGQRIKDKFWYCRLSPNYKTLLYGDCDDEQLKGADGDKLVNKLNITDIDQLLVGRDCPHMRENKSKKSTISLAFALIPKDDSVQNLCFCASNEETFNYWMDGLNALLGKSMTSKEAQENSEMLLDLDIKLRLLDIEGLSIPDKMPEIPPLPTSFDFSIKSSVN